MILAVLLIISYSSEKKAAGFQRGIAETDEETAAAMSEEEIKVYPYLKIGCVLLKGIPVTFLATISAIIGSVTLGLLVGLGQISYNQIINRISSVHVEMIRGIPLLVQLIFIYFALGKIFKLEGIFAAIALGMTRGQALRLVVLPQAVRVIFPAIGNEFIAMLKDSSLVSVLALPDLLRRGREYVSRTFQSLKTYAMVALIYLIITLLLSRIAGLLEERMKKNER